jgi:hypothetical protein
MLPNLSFISFENDPMGFDELMGRHGSKHERYFLRFGHF